MIGAVIVPTRWNTEVDGHTAVEPVLPVGHGPWSDITGAFPHPPEPVVVRVTASQEWFNSLPEGSVLWIE